MKLRRANCSIQCPTCGRVCLTPAGLGSHVYAAHGPGNAFKGHTHLQKTKRVNREKHLGKTFTLSVEARRKVSESKRGRRRLDMTGGNNPAKRPEVRKKISAWLRNAPAEWYAWRMERCALKPTRPELALEARIRELNLPYDYVGDGQLIIGGKCPDFANLDGQKKLIEMFGDHWHKPEDEGIRAKHFARYGYRLLVIWQHELTDTVAVEKKLLEFNSTKEVI